MSVNSGILPAPSPIKKPSTVRTNKEWVAQKPLSVKLNAPRFFRQGDHIELAATIANFSDSELTGQVQLELRDASSFQSVDGWFINSFPNQYFTVGAQQRAVVLFPIQVPYEYQNALALKITASSGNLSDVEEDVLPVLSDKLLVTDIFSFTNKGNTDKKYTFQDLYASAKLESIQNQSLTVEYASDPAWYVIKALPYVLHFPYKSAEQSWNEYFLYALNSFLLQHAPRLRKIIDGWKNNNTTLFDSLQKNQQGTTSLLEETPWLLDEIDETAQKNIARLLDPKHMDTAMLSSLNKLEALQNMNGSFSWFTGGPDDFYITQYIVAGIGRLKNISADFLTSALTEIAKKAIRWLDDKIVDWYSSARKTARPEINGPEVIQYLYARSYFKEYSMTQTTRTANEYYLSLAANNWTQQGKYLQAMIALALSRNGAKRKALSIMHILKTTAMHSANGGVYWKDMHPEKTVSFSVVEAESLAAEAFWEIEDDSKRREEINNWMIQHKQPGGWSSTMATADACYALLLNGPGWARSTPLMDIQLGRLSLPSKELERAASEGYFYKIIPGNLVKPEMGKISILANNDKSTDSAAVWRGQVYWQYYIDRNKGRTSNVGLALHKELFIEKQTEKGVRLAPVHDETQLHVGDKIHVQITVKTNRDLQYLQLKDFRAAAMEPVSLPNGYRHQAGVDFYQALGSTSINFFFSTLPKGSYVFQYPVLIVRAGNFSTGLTTIKCIYAPVVSREVEGKRIDVEN